MITTLATLKRPNVNIYFTQSAFAAKSILNDAYHIMKISSDPSKRSLLYEIKCTLTGNSTLYTRCTYHWCLENKKVL